MFQTLVYRRETVVLAMSDFQIIELKTIGYDSVNRRHEMNFMTLSALHIITKYTV
jgi:hypothetical protein